MMNGTVYQQALSSVFWMNYKKALRLAVVQDDSAESKTLARRRSAWSRTRPSWCRCRPSSPAGRT